MEEKVFIYGDEFGTSTLKSNDTKNITHFVYAAVVIKESNLDKAKEVRDFLSINYFYGKEIKSSSRIFKKNPQQRLEILDYLVNNLNFIVYLFVIDKEKLDKDKGGLRFKEVFYKYFQRIFLSNLNNNYNDFEIHMDNLINEDYQIELKNYLAEYYQNNFFENYNMSDDKNEPLIQLADIIAGSYGRVFNKSFYSEISDNILEILKSKTANVAFFPFEQSSNIFNFKQEIKIDEEILNIVSSDASEILLKNDDLIINDIIEYLLWNQKVNPFQYAQTYEIIGAVKYNTGKILSIESLRTIIKELRFKGMIIVSSSSKSGYKLAVNKADVYTYFKHYLNYIIPMLKKVEIANSIFMNKTVGDFTPLEEMNELKELVSTLK